MKTPFVIILLSGFILLLSCPCTAQSPQETSAAERDPNLPEINISFSEHGEDPNSANSSENENSDPFTDPQTDREISEPQIPEFIDASDSLFSTYVNEKHLVNYNELRRHRGDLIQICRTLESIHPAHIMSLERDGKIAFWINTYNLCILKLIVDHYPIEPKFYMIFYPDNSIMQISNAWTKQYFDVMGLEYTLNEIQNELLLDRFNDPRICFALSYASLGGGRLNSYAYRPDRIDEQLDQQVRGYLTTNFGYKLDKEERIIYLSNLFATHREVFLKSEYDEIKKFRSYPDHERAWLNFLISYIPEEDVKFIENNSCSIRMIRFDWTLDETK